MWINRFSILIMDPDFWILSVRYTHYQTWRCKHPKSFFLPMRGLSPPEAPLPLFGSLSWALDLRLIRMMIESFEKQESIFLGKTHGAYPYVSPEICWEVQDFAYSLTQVLMEPFLDLLSLLLPDLFLKKNHAKVLSKYLFMASNKPIRMIINRNIRIKPRMKGSSNQEVA